jgi:DNA-binding phage protein
MSQLSRSYHDELLKDLTDPQEAAAYLNAALEEGSAELFLIALRNIAEARNLKKYDENILFSDLIHILDNAGLRFMPNHA